MNRTYLGGVFSDRLASGREKAEIDVKEQSVQATTPSGLVFSFPYAESRLELGGASGAMIFLRTEQDRNTLYCEDSGFQEALLDSSFASDLRPLLEQKRKRKQRVYLSIVSVFAVMVMMLWGAFSVLGQLAGYAIALIPSDIDEKFGQLAYDMMDHGGPEVKEPAIVQPVQQLVDILERAVQEETNGNWAFRVHVVEADIQNAYALPGGYIVVYTGLLEDMERPEQLAGVLAHEMAHVTERHSVERLVEMAGIAVVIDGLIGDVEGMIALGAELLSFSTVNAYSRAAETEADLRGLAFLERAQIDPTGLIEFFAIMEEEQDPVSSLVPEWASTHPDFQSRIQVIEAQIDKNQKNEELAGKIAWKELKSHMD